MLLLRADGGIEENVERKSRCTGYPGEVAVEFGVGHEAAQDDLSGTPEPVDEKPFATDEDCCFLDGELV